MLFAGNERSSGDSAQQTAQRHSVQTRINWGRGGRGKLDGESERQNRKAGKDKSLTDCEVTDSL